MSKQQTKILLLVEGERREKDLMNHLLKVYEINESHEIVSYKTSIYDLYDRMFLGDGPEMLDLLQVLKEHEKDPAVKVIFDDHYSDVILIFDLDPQAPLFSKEKIIRMAEYFNESTENGKLYINFPMVEAFYHMKSIPDPAYEAYMVSIDELKDGNYKDRVKKTCRIPYRKFAETRELCDIVINQNLSKALMITKEKKNSTSISMTDLLNQQITMLVEKEAFYVLCTCIFYILDFNPNLVSVRLSTISKKDRFGGIWQAVDQ